MITMNLPNLLTIVRIVLVPVFLLLILADSFYLAAVVFAVAGLTDTLDGIIARRLSSVTKFGAQLDPVADKLLLSSAFIALSLKGFLPLWLTIIVVARDIVMLTIVIILKRIKYAINTRPMITGKLTTFFQIITVLSALLAQRFYGAQALYIFTGFITVLGAALYAMRATHMDLKIFKSG